MESGRGSQLKPASADNDSGSSTKKPLVKVVEYYMLLEIRPDTTNDDVLKMMGGMWSLQYLIPNVLSASAGAILDLESPPSGGQPGGQPGAWSGFTHALNFRFGNIEFAEAFRKHESYLKAFVEELDPLCTRVAEVVAVVDVPNDLGAIFRRGGSWEEGVEHMLVVELQDVDRRAAVDEYLGTLGDVAESSACGALVSSRGPLAEMSGRRERGQKSEDPKADVTPMLAMLTRVPSFESYRAFVGLPPMQSLLGTGVDGLLRPVLSLCFEVTPADDQKTKSPADGRIP